MIKSIINNCSEKNANTLENKKVIRYITDDLKNSSDDSDESDEE